MTHALIPPPVARTSRGEPRRIGVEIEFHGPDVETTAAEVQSLFGGRIEATDPYRCNIEDTRFGAFTVELDSSLAHPEKSDDEDAPLTERVKAGLANLAGDVIGLWMPTEVCAPPVPIDRLPELQPLIDRLRARGAVGTRASPAYGFGMQLNVEVAAETAEYVTRHLKAYLLLSDWLRADIKVDPTRRLLPYVDPFPRDYVLKVVDPDYAPDMKQLIDDYLDANPTRNRELDMLPLFAHLDSHRVADRFQGQSVKIKARPTFHYRLPNSLVDDPDWGGAVGEWNRWVRVEQLAHDGDRLAETGRAYRDHHADELAGWIDWLRSKMP